MTVRLQVSIIESWTAKTEKTNWTSSTCTRFRRVLLTMDIEAQDQKVKHFGENLKKFEMAFVYLFVYTFLKLRSDTDRDFSTLRHFLK